MRLESHHIATPAGQENSGPWGVRQFDPKSFRYICFLLALWAFCYVLVSPLTSLGFAIDTMIIGGIVGLVIVNMLTDASGLRNLLLVLSAVSLSLFPVRYQVAHGMVASTSPLNTALFVIVVALLLVELGRRRTHGLPKGIWPMVAYLGIALSVAVLSSQPFANTRRFLYGATFNYLMFLITFLIAHRSGARTVLSSILLLLLLFGIVDVIYGLYQFLFGIPEFELMAFEQLGVQEYIVFSERFIKIIGLSGSAYGLFYSLTFYIVGFSLLLPLFRGVLKWAAISLVIGSCVLLMSFSERTAIILVVLAVLTAWGFMKSQARLGRLIVYAVGLVAVIAVSIPLIDTVLQSAFGDEGLRFERMRELTSPSEAANIIWRYGKWEEGLASIPSSLLLGDGYAGEFGYHMEYLNVLVTFGISGFVCWLLILTSVFRRLRNILLLEPKHTFVYRVALGLVSFFAALLAAAIPNNPFTYSCGLILFLLVAPLFHIGSDQIMNPAVTKKSRQ